MDGMKKFRFQIAYCQCKLLQSNAGIMKTPLAVMFELRG